MPPAKPQSQNYDSSKALKISTDSTTNITNSTTSFTFHSKQCKSKPFDTTSSSLEPFDPISDSFSKLPDSRTSFSSLSSNDTSLFENKETFFESESDLDLEPDLDNYAFAMDLTSLTFPCAAPAPASVSVSVSSLHDTNCTDTPTVTTTVSELTSPELHNSKLYDENKENLNNIVDAKQIVSNTSFKPKPLAKEKIYPDNSKKFTTGKSATAILDEIPKGLVEFFSDDDMEGKNIDENNSEDYDDNARNGEEDVNYNNNKEKKYDATNNDDDVILLTSSSAAEEFDLTNFKGRPSSCVFVASLSSNLSEDDLAHSVKNHFKKWGQLAFVKVLRDPANRPYSFVQYTNDADAKRAIKEGQHSVLNGRTIRCEKANVNRTLYLTSSTVGKKLNKLFVHQMLSEYGEVENLITLDENEEYTELTDSDSSDMWFVRFVFRDEAINAFTSLKENKEYTIQWARNIDLDDEDDGPNVVIDKFSIFVGQLDPSISKEKLMERFKRHGKIKEAVLVNRDILNFAFIKYETELGAATAVERENHSIFKTRTIQVQYREMFKNSKLKTPDAPKLALAPPPVHFHKKKNRPRPSFNPFQSHDEPYHSSQKFTMAPIGGYPNTVYVNSNNRRRNFSSNFGVKSNYNQHESNYYSATTNSDNASPYKAQSYGFRSKKERGSRDNKNWNSGYHDNDSRSPRDRFGNNKFSQSSSNGNTSRRPFNLNSSDGNYKSNRVGRPNNNNNYEYKKYTIGSLRAAKHTTDLDSDNHSSLLPNDLPSSPLTETEELASPPDQTSNKSSTLNNGFGSTSYSHLNDTDDDDNDDHDGNAEDNNGSVDNYSPSAFNISKKKNTFGSPSNLLDYENSFIPQPIYYYIAPPSKDMHQMYPYAYDPPATASPMIPNSSHQALVPPPSATYYPPPQFPMGLATSHMLPGDPNAGVVPYYMYFPPPTVSTPYHMPGGAVDETYMSPSIGNKPVNLPNSVIGLGIMNPQAGLGDATNNLGELDISSNNHM